MVLFDETRCIAICLKNTNSYVRLAVEDLRRDFQNRSTAGHLPALVSSQEVPCIVIEENDPAIKEPTEDESFSVCREGDRIRVTAPTYLGTMWAIYTFSEKVLGIDPCYLFNDLKIEKLKTLDIAIPTIRERPEGFRFRGLFINDEDLLTGWTDKGAVRPISYAYYQLTVPPEVIDRVVETALRNKLNLVIPASFLNIDHAPEKALADCVAKRGIYLSQHHVEPLGVSHFTFEEYCRAQGLPEEFSYMRHPENFRLAWRHFAKKWAQYDHVIWQVGLRGKEDRPLWEDALPTDEELKTYGAFISEAIKTQQQIVREETGGRAEFFTSTIWMEGSLLTEKGFLDLDQNVCLVFADNGPNQMFGNEFQRIRRLDDRRYGIYYHLAYCGIGPHLAPQTGLNKLAYNLKRAFDKGDRAYGILNISNVREFTFELGAAAALLWNTGAFCEKTYSESYCRRVFGEKAAAAQKLIADYFEKMPVLETEELRNLYAELFNYDYAEVSPHVKNFALKEGTVRHFGLLLAQAFTEPLPCTIYPKMAEELKRAIPVYEALAGDFASLGEACPDASLHTKVKWELSCETLSGFYRWFVGLYEAKCAWDRRDADGARRGIENACGALKRYLAFRRCAEYGEFDNWYRGDVKMDVQEMLAITGRAIGYRP